MKYSEIGGLLLDDVGIFTDRCSTTASTPESLTPNMRVSRSVSLHSALKKPNRYSNTSPVKKAVHFADTMGLDLVHVQPLFYFGDATGVDIDDEGYIDELSLATAASAFTIRSPFLIAPFKQHHRSSSSNKRMPSQLTKRFELTSTYEQICERAIAHGVCFKAITIVDMIVTGLVCVANISYHKQIYARYTLDEWRTWTEVPAIYISSDRQANIDTFSFSIFLPNELPIGARIEFSIRYRIHNAEYWDNNEGINYCIDCIPAIPNS